MQSKGPQARRDPLRLVRILGPSEPDVLVAADESDAFGKSIRSFEESFSYRFPDDGCLWTSGITLHRFSVTKPRTARRWRIAIQLLYVQILHARIGSELRRISCLVFRLPVLSS
jgi:hypothetical protein